MQPSRPQAPPADRRQLPLLPLQVVAWRGAAVDHHGSHAQQWQGQEPLGSALQADLALVAEGHPHRGAAGRKGLPVGDGGTLRRAAAAAAEGAFEPRAVWAAHPTSPTSITPPSNILLQVNETIGKMAKKGLTPSQIGVLLRDSHGIAQVKSVTGSKILRLLKAQGERRSSCMGQGGAGRGLRSSAQLCSVAFACVRGARACAFCRCCAPCAWCMPCRRSWSPTPACLTAVMRAVLRRAAQLPLAGCRVLAGGWVRLPRAAPRARRPPLLPTPALQASARPHGLLLPSSGCRVPGPAAATRAHAWPATGKPGRRNGAGASTRAVPPTADSKWRAVPGSPGGWPTLLKRTVRECDRSACPRPGARRPCS